MIPSFTFNDAGLQLRVGAKNSTTNEVVLEVSSPDGSATVLLTSEEAAMLGYALITQARAETV